MRKLFSFRMLFFPISICCLFAAYPASGQPSQFVEGSLSFTPARVEGVVAYIQLFEGTIEEGNLYIERTSTTCRPFTFRIPVDQGIQLENMYVNIVIHEPEGFGCPYKNLKASQRERLKQIPVRRTDDLYLIAGAKMRAAINQGNINRAKYEYAEVRSWATKPDQSLIAALDISDFLSQYKTERQDVVTLLGKMVNNVQESSPGIQKRYWRTRRDSVIRLTGFNDFKAIPLKQFIVNITESGDPASNKAWMEFTSSIASAIENGSALTKSVLPQNELNALRAGNLNDSDVLMQLRILDSILGPAITTSVDTFVKNQ